MITHTPYETMKYSMLSIDALQRAEWGIYWVSGVVGLSR